MRLDQERGQYGRGDVSRLCRAFIENVPQCRTLPIHDRVIQIVAKPGQQVVLIVPNCIEGAGGYIRIQFRA